jgi:hypothetical protein
MMQIVSNVYMGIDAFALLSERSPALRRRLLSAEGGMLGFTMAYTILKRRFRSSHFLHACLLLVVLGQGFKPWDV